MVDKRRVLVLMLACILATVFSRTDAFELSSGITRLFSVFSSEDVQEDHHFDEDQEQAPMDKAFVIGKGEKYRHPLSGGEDTPSRSTREILGRVGTVDECRRELADSLLTSTGCYEGMQSVKERETWKDRLALAITNCHLKRNGRKEYTSCDAKNDPKRCIGAMNDDDFQIFTLFLLNIERICGEMYHEKWQRSVEQLVSVLHFEGLRAVENLERAAEAQQAIFDTQMELRESLEEEFENQERIMRELASEGQAVVEGVSEQLKSHVTTKVDELQGNLYLSLNLSHEMMELQARGLEYQKLQFQRIANDIGESLAMEEESLRRLGRLNATSNEISESLLKQQDVLGEHAMAIYEVRESMDLVFDRWFPILKSVTSIQTLLFYMISYSVLRTLVGFDRASDARLVVMLCFTLSLSAELIIVPELLKTQNLEYEEELALRVWIRYGFTALALFAVLYSCLASLRRQQRYISREDSIRLIQQVQDNAQGREYLNRKLIDHLIDQLVKWRIESEENRFKLSPMSDNLLNLLQAPPPGYESCLRDTSMEEDAYHFPLHDDKPLPDELFCPDAFGTDSHSSIRPL